MGMVRGAWAERRRLGVVVAAALCAVLLAAGRLHAQSDPLSSWNDGPAKQAILSFVREVTDKSGPKYVAPADRIATFDQDGTLWVSHPLYAQSIFAIDRLRELAPQHPEWQQQEPFKAVIAGGPEAMARLDESGWAVIVAATHSGMSTEAQMDEAQRRGWNVISMKKDWKRVFAFDK